MIVNPELRRNIWLDFTFHRVIITPVVISLIAYLFYLTGGLQSSGDITFNLACIFIFLWGTKRASETVIDEVTNSTWDFQRQSAISPTQMTWGKLIGATLYSWYGAFICLLFYVCFHNSETRPLFSESLGIVSSSLSVPQEIILLLLGGLFSQGLALLFSLQILNQIRSDKINRSFRYFVFGATIGILITKFTFSALKLNTTLTWHGMTFATGPFALYSLMIFLGWTIVGLQRSFCKELQYQNIPWIWALFNLFCVIYFSGLMPAEKLPFDSIGITELRDLQHQLLKAPLYVAFFVAQALTYFALFSDTLSVIRYKYFFTRIHEKNIIESLQQLPWWPISFCLTVILGLLVAFAQTSHSIFKDFSPSIFTLTTVLFLMRDICLIHFFNFAKSPRSATGSAFLYIFILYILFPLLLKALGLGTLLPILLPSWGQNTLLAIVSCGAQIAFFFWLTLKRWHQNMDSNLRVEKT
ncbi:MAG: hypothetical protein AB7V32_10395 [Candidatus Berkiella sp.]